MRITRTGSLSPAAEYMRVSHPALTVTYVPSVATQYMPLRIVLLEKTNPNTRIPQGRNDRESGHRSKITIW